MSTAPDPYYPAYQQEVLEEPQVDQQGYGLFILDRLCIEYGLSRWTPQQVANWLIGSKFLLNFETKTWSRQKEGEQPIGTRRATWEYSAAYYFQGLVSHERNYSYPDGDEGEEGKDYSLGHILGVPLNEALFRMDYVTFKSKGEGENRKLVSGSFIVGYEGAAPPIVNPQKRVVVDEGEGGEHKYIKKEDSSKSVVKHRSGSHVKHSSNHGKRSGRVKKEERDAITAATQVNTQQSRNPSVFIIHPDGSVIDIAPMIDGTKLDGSVLSVRSVDGTEAKGTGVAGTASCANETGLESMASRTELGSVF